MRDYVGLSDLRSALVERDGESIAEKFDALLAKGLHCVGVSADAQLSDFAIQPVAGSEQVERFLETTRSQHRLFVGVFGFIEGEPSSVLVRLLDSESVISLARAYGAHLNQGFNAAMRAHGLTVLASQRGIN